MRKKKIQDKKINLSTMDFKYCGIEYSIDYYDLNDCSPDCDCYHCGDQGISGVDITEVDIHKIIDSICDNLSVKDEVNKYCISRLCHIYKLYQAGSYVANHDSGYYGDELNSITIEERLAEDLSRYIEEILSMNNLKEKILCILQHEYNFILPEINEATFDYHVADINDEDENSKINNCGYHDGHMVKLDKSVIAHYKDYDGIVGVFIDYGNKYRLIDGYHRFSAWKKSNNGLLKMIRLKV